MKYRGPCIDCGEFKNQNYTKKLCAACYQKFRRLNKDYAPRTKYKGPCIHCGTIESTDGRFVRKMCSKCYGRFKLDGNPTRKEKKKHEGPCIVCGATSPGYRKYFQEKMCGKCYRRYSHIRDNPPKKPKHCIDCNKEISPRVFLERCRTCHRKYRWRTDPKYKQQRITSIKRYGKTKNGIETQRAHVRRRRAQLAQVENTLTKEQWQAVLEKFKHRCAYCGSKKSIEMDHIIPISKGGAHAIHNVVPACRSCNASKNDDLPPSPVQPLLT